MAKKKVNKTGIGTLELRGNTWLARWVVNGKRYTRSTGCEKKDRDGALKKLQEFTAEFVLKDERRALENIEARIRGIDRQYEEIQDGKPALRFAEAWSVYLNSQSRPRSGAGTIRNYEQQYFIFVDWLKSYHPDIIEVRQVSPDIAAEYAQALLNGTTDGTRKAIAEAKKKLVRLYETPEENRSELEKTEIEKCERIAAITIRTPVRGTTFNRHVNALALVWRHIAHSTTAHIKENPWGWDENTGRGIRRIKLTHAERPRTRRDLTLEEVYKLINAAEGEMRVLIATGFYTGLRLGDAALLSWGNVDRVNGMINVRSRKTDTETKTAIHPALAKIFDAELKTKSGYLMPEIATMYNKGTTGRCRINDLLTNLFSSVGIETSAKNDGDVRAHSVCGFHSLRHTFVTALRNRGASLFATKELAGHHTTAMTEHYTHDNARAVFALPDMTGEQPDVIECECSPLMPESKQPEQASKEICDLWDGWSNEQRAMFVCDCAKIFAWTKTNNSNVGKESK